jgi:putative peptide zinc metalloprotease protein
LRPLFLPPVMVGVVAGVVAVDTWLFFFHGVTASARHLVYRPLGLLLVAALVVVAGAFHELGHGTACRYGGGRPGRIGFGLYLVWPVFYSDVTDSYRLDRRGRLRTDLGGIYFNLVFVLVSGCVYLVAGGEALVVVVVVQHLVVLQQFLPFVRLDGYYVLADLTGVADLYAYVGPVLTTLVRRRPPPRAIADLRRSTRRAITAWVLATVPVLVATAALLATRAPQMVTTARTSMAGHWRALSDAVARGRPVVALVGVVELATVALPLVAMALTAGLIVVRTGRRLGRGWAKRTARSKLEEPEPKRGIASDGEEGSERRPAEPVTALGGLADAWAGLQTDAQELLGEIARARGDAERELSRAREMHAEALAAACAIREQAQRDAAELLDRAREHIESALRQVCDALDPASSPS